MPINRRLAAYADQMSAHTGGRTSGGGGLLGWGADPSLGEQTIFSKTAEVDPAGGFKTDTAAGRRLNSRTEQEKQIAAIKLQTALEEYKGTTGTDISNVKELNKIKNINLGAAARGGGTTDEERGNELALAGDVRKSKSEQLGSEQDKTIIPAEGNLKREQLQQELRIAAQMADAKLRQQQGLGEKANINDVGQFGSVLTKPGLRELAQPAMQQKTPSSIDPKTGAISGGGTVLSPASIKPNQIDPSKYPGILNGGVNPAVNPGNPGGMPGQSVANTPAGVTPKPPIPQRPILEPPLQGTGNNPIPQSVTGELFPQVNQPANLLSPTAQPNQQDLIKSLLDRIIQQRLNPVRPQF